MQIAKKGELSVGHTVIALLPEGLTLVGKVTELSPQGAWAQVGLEEPGIAANLGYDGHATFTWRPGQTAYLLKHQRHERSNGLRILKEKRRGRHAP